MTASYVVREADPLELPLLGALELRAAQRFRGTRHAYAADLPAFDPTKLSELARDKSVFVAAHASQIVGFAIGGRLGSAAYLHELDVEAEHGRRGLGRALVRRVAEWADARGQASLLLSTFSDVAWNAPLYAKLGFEVIPLAAYDAAMVRLREDEGAAGLELQSRVMMRAAVARLLLPEP
jgi:GNAT superfamily N-acetyltransferase